MALLFIDSCAHYTAAQQPKGKWTSNGSVNIVSVPGLTGSGSAFNGSANKSIGAYPQFVTGARFNLTQAMSGLITFDNAVYATTAHLNVESDGRFTVVGNSLGLSNTQKSSPTALVTFNSIYHIVFDCTATPISVDATHYKMTFTWNVYINSVLVWSDSMTTTSGTNSGFSLSVYTFFEVDYHISALGGAWVGDIWVTDGENLGDVQIVALFARAEGTKLNWTTSTGTVHWTLVSSHTTSDATYNYSSNSGDYDEYYMDTIGSAFTGTILGAQLVLRAENDGIGGSAPIQGVYRNGSSTEILTVSTYGPSVSNYLYFLDPQRYSVFNTGTNWTQAEIDAMQCGVFKD